MAPFSYTVVGSFHGFVSGVEIVLGKVCTEHRGFKMVYQGLVMNWGVMLMILCIVFCCFVLPGDVRALAIQP